MEEIWKHIESLKGYYSVSNIGRIRREVTAYGTYKGKIIKPRKHPFGYNYFAASVDGELHNNLAIHRIVLKEFVGPPPTVSHHCNHINSDPSDNRVENLEWATISENVKHSYSHGKRIKQTGEAASGAKITEKDVKEILNRVANREYIKDIAKDYPIAVGAITEIINGYHWKHVQRPDLSNKRKGRDILTDKAVIEIVSLLKSGVSCGELSKRFSVSRPTIWQIKAGRTWKHIER